MQIALVGKYTALHDAYLSVVEALGHAGTANDAVVNIKWVDSETLNEDNVREVLSDCSGILVPGGFGDRGIEGMILAAQYARETNTPYFGICLGMQMAVIEYSRNVAGLKGAHSSEFVVNGEYPVIDLMSDQVGITAKGGTMRLGKYPCTLQSGSQSAKCYGESDIWERHRHRYEFNNKYRDLLSEKGLLIAGTSPNGKLVGICGDTGATPGMWGFSSTRNLKAVQTGRIHCSEDLLRLRWGRKNDKSARFSSGFWRTVQGADCAARKGVQSELRNKAGKYAHRGD